MLYNLNDKTFPVKAKHETCGEQGINEVYPKTGLPRVWTRESQEAWVYLGMHYESQSQFPRHV